jgi:membrane protein DedA with SNARE-associated domain
MAPTVTHPYRGRDAALPDGLHEGFPVESLIDVIEPYFVRWGYLIVFGLGVLENSAFVGAVIPGDVVLLLAGFYVERSSLDLGPVVLLAFFGALIGDTIGYSIGRFGGRRIVERFGGNRFLPTERLELVDRYFKEYGMWAVALGRLAPVVRTVNTFAAGMARMPFAQYIAAVAIAASVWAVAVPVLGFFFSESLHVVKSALGWAGVAILVLFAAALYLTYRRFSHRVAAEALRRRGLPTPEESDI